MKHCTYSLSDSIESSYSWHRYWEFSLTIRSGGSRPTECTHWELDGGWLATASSAGVSHESSWWMWGRLHDGKKGHHCHHRTFWQHWVVLLWQSGSLEFLVARIILYQGCQEHDSHSSRAPRFFGFAVFGVLCFCGWLWFIDETPILNQPQASSSSAPAEERPQERSERGEKGEKGDKGGDTERNLDILSSKTWHRWLAK